MRVDYRIIICGMLCLTAIYIALVIDGDASETLGYAILMLIGFGMGVIIPNPKLDNKRGVLVW